MSNKRTITFEKIVIPEDEIKKMTSSNKKRYLMLSNMIRDLNLLQKVLLYIKNTHDNHEVLISGNAVASFFFLKTLISKNYEIKQFINYEGIINEKGNFTEELLKKFIDIEDFFSKAEVTELFDFIRNKFSFHYEYQKDIEPLLEQIMNDFDGIEMFLSHDSVNEIFSSSNAIMIKAIFIKMQNLGYKGDDTVLMNKLFSLAVESSRICREFCTHYLVERILYNINCLHKDTISLEAPLLSECHLHFIVSGQKIS